MKTLTEHERHIARVAADLAIDELRPPLHRFRTAIGAVVVLVVAAIVVGGLLLQGEAKSRSNAIQHSRFEASRDNCRAQNERNRETLLGLDRVAATQPSSGESKRARARQLAATKFLINQIVPYRANCTLVATRATATP